MDPGTRTAVHAQVDEQLEDDVARIQRWVRQPNVSWHDHGVKDMARLVADELQDLGCGDVEVLEGRFQPAVWGRLEVGAPVTVQFAGYCPAEGGTQRNLEHGVGLPDCPLQHLGEREPSKRPSSPTRWPVG